jgi:hypothetical protein
LKFEGGGWRRVCVEEIFATKAKRGRKEILESFLFIRNHWSLGGSGGSGGMHDGIRKM